MEQVEIKNETELGGLAKKLVSELLARESAGALAIGLVGELGAGKTTLVKYFLRELGVSESVLSPTFVLMKKYGLEEKKYKNAIHVDCYRLEDPVSALSALGFSEILKNKNNLVLVEWAERIKDILPADTLWIELIYCEGEGRTVRVGSVNSAILKA